MTEPEETHAEELERDADPPVVVDPEQASTNFYWTFGKVEVFNLQTTLRGNLTAAEIQAHFQTAIEGMKQVLANGGHAKAVGWQAKDAATAIIPTPATPTQAAVETGKAIVPPTPNVSVPAYAATNQESQCVLIKIGESYTAKKPQLQFEVNGREHPLSYTKSVPDMAKLLAPLGFTAAHIVVGQKYSVNCIVTWRMGDKYPDVLSVRPA